MGQLAAESERPVSHSLDRQEDKDGCGRAEGQGSSRGAE